MKTLSTILIAPFITAMLCIPSVVAYFAFDVALEAHRNGFGSFTFKAIIFVIIVTLQLAVIGALISFWDIERGKIK